MKKNAKNRKIKIVLFCLVAILIFQVFFLAILLNKRSDGLENTESFSPQKITEHVKEFGFTPTGEFVEDPVTGMRFEGGIILVVCHEGVSYEQVVSAAESVDGEVVGGIEEIRTYEISIPEKDAISTRKAADSLNEMTHLFEVAGPNYAVGFD